MKHFKDKKGLEIKGHNIIFNPYNEPKEMQLIEIENVICFTDGEPLSKKHQTNVFWEIIK